MNAMSYEKKYQFWLNQKDLDSTLLKELIELNEEQIQEVFFNDLSFGTGGLRGLMGAGTNRVNVYTIRKASKGFANYINHHQIKGGVAISYDNRHYSQKFAKEAAMVLASAGIPSYLFEEMRPTPMLSFAVRHFKCAGGIMITASHNPKEYNGYKVYDQTGAQVNLETAEKIIKEIDAVENPFEIDILDNELIHTIDASFDHIYLKEVKKISLTPKDPQVKIVYSPLHGTGGTVIPGLLKEAGYDIYPYLPQMIADPNFSNTLSSNPEEEKAYVETIKYAKEIDADLIMITDPDADRLGIAVKHQGEYVLLNGNQTAALELFYILSERRKKNMLPPNGVVYKTIVTTDLIDQIAMSFNIPTQKTLTGFKFIGEKAEKNKHKMTYLFGCEESYGSLISDFVRDKDAVQACYMLAEMTNYTSHIHMTLIDYLNHIYQAYGYYYEYTKSITLPGLSGLDKINQLMAHFRNHPPVIENKGLLSFDDFESGLKTTNNQQTKLDLPASNVLKYYYEDHTWIVFRPSGTEPKIKIYFQTVSSSIEEAKTFIDGVLKQLMKEINAL
jgi:phosphoglucomutase